MPKVDLLLINPSNRREVYQELGKSLTAIEPPVWCGLFASFIRTKGFECAIIDQEAEGLTPEAVSVRASEFDPVLTAIVVYGHQPSASTQNMTAASVMCSTLKESNPQLKLILVGGHVAALPRQTLVEESADFVAGGEGLFTLSDLLSELKSSSPNLSSVRGLWYVDNEQIKFNAAAPLVSDLDNDMPGIAWDLLPMERYRAHNWHCLGGLDRQPYAAIYTTLGCPFHCSFCCIQAPFKSGELIKGLRPETNSYRFWSPESVISQIDILVNQYGVRNIKIADEMFVLNARHIGAICDLIIERGYDLNIWAYSRVDTIKDGMLEKLKKAGFTWLAFGIEAANAKVRDDVQKGFDQNDIARTIQQVKDTGINIIGNFIFGLPEDNLETMQETLDMAIDLNCEFANFYCTMAYPGSQLYDNAIAQGLPLPASWSGYSQHARHTAPLPTKYLSASDVVNFRDKAFTTYYSNEAYLSSIAKKFGSVTESEIRAMIAHKMVRDPNPPTIIK